jgi:hypothetical protein
VCALLISLLCAGCYIVHPVFKTSLQQQQNTYLQLFAGMAQRTMPHDVWTPCVYVWLSCAAMRTVLLRCRLPLAGPVYGCSRTLTPRGGSALLCNTICSICYACVSLVILILCVFEGLNWLAGHACHRACCWSCRC